MIDQRKENIETSKIGRSIKKAEDQSTKKDHRFWAGQHGAAVKGLSAKNDSGFLNAYNIVDPGNKEDMKLLQDDPSYIKTIDTRLAEGLYETINYLEKGMEFTSNEIETALAAYKSAGNEEDRKKIMWDLSTTLLGADGQKSYEQFHTGQGDLIGEDLRLSGDRKYTKPVYLLMKHFMANYAKEIHADMMTDVGEDPASLFTP